MPPGDLRDLLTDGIIGGVGGIVIFLPQILILFFFVGLLESTGYMARAAFIMDRLMGKRGAEWPKSFIPLLSSYACAIPGHHGHAHHRGRRSDRLVTILVAPLMSCSARLPVYLLLIAARCVPGDVVPAGTKARHHAADVCARHRSASFGFAWLFQAARCCKGNAAAPHPRAARPTGHRARKDLGLRHMLERGGALREERAGTVILGHVHSSSGSLARRIRRHSESRGERHRAARAKLSSARMGHAHRARRSGRLDSTGSIGIGLVTSFAAREVFVSTRWAWSSAPRGEDEEDTAPLRDALRAPRHLGGRGVRCSRRSCALNLMVFYVFAMQCMSTVAVVKRETNSWRWPLFQVFYMTGTAWLVCLIFYQAGRALGY